MEKLFAFFDDPKPLYLEYGKGKANGKEQHKHAPLEEALANAYAYNSFSFINREGWLQDGRGKSFSSSYDKILET